ncbi:hypothetical protein HS048_12180 [Planomonospora sp. ID91781]|uniref:hypothetical protein n=1 Tax=Planomonospora sp. ID91781 TaxID=2738135 RepID=UPI0018C3B6E3|nr:hypothetical protein [Planomonospora sp. ID91781]MBG0821490.1 hypothetical protein [Planomonospora sp. ID91781]
MKGFDLHFDALEECANKARSVANQFRSTADERPADVGSSCFGKLGDASGRLAEAVRKLEGKIEAETRYAQRNLDKVEAALHTVIANVRRADGPDVPVESV